MLSYSTIIHCLIRKWYNSYIHEYSWKHEKLEKIVEQFRGVPRKLSYFQLPIAIEYQTLYEINAKVEPIYIMIRYANYLIILFMNINENIRNERKS